MKLSSYSVVVLLLAGLLQGCGSLIVGGGSPGGGTSSGQTSTDAAITSRINTRYVNDSLVRALDIRVNTYQGVVTLYGTIDSPEVMAHAVELARTTSGVRRVVSRLTVTP
ncbi:MAG: BON domain-containing protein [Halobacteria archaeon]|nr:BON domain-containing protein [Halobacteria archaeon]